MPIQVKEARSLSEQLEALALKLGAADGPFTAMDLNQCAAQAKGMEVRISTLERLLEEDAKATEDSQAITARYMSDAAEAQEHAKNLAQDLQRATAARARTQQWYAVRWERLKEWARSEIPEDLSHEFFSIVANGTKNVSEEPTYAQQLNLAVFRAEEMGKHVLAKDAEIVRLTADLAKYTVLHPAADWHEGIGDAVWYRYPITEPPSVGSPLVVGWPEDYYTHWTYLPYNPEPPAQTEESPCKAI